MISIINALRRRTCAGGVSVFSSMRNVNMLFRRGGIIKLPYGIWAEWPIKRPNAIRINVAVRGRPV